MEQEKIKIFLIGDYRSGTGPANVTLEYKNRIPGVLLQRMRSKALRVPELIVKILRSDVILLSGHSRQNVLSLKIARRFHKRSAFLMHGCVEHENAINGVPDASMNETERKTMEGADAIYAVSAHFADWLKTNYPEHAGKISAVPNGMDLTAQSLPQTAEKIKHRLISVGGGMPRKQIRYIAEAVMRLRQESAYADTELIVIGAKGLDTEAVNAFPCVRDLGIVSREKTMELLGSSELFIQNSCFETFGLAPLEALKAGTSLLLSTEIGATELIPGLQDGDLIRDTHDPEEIAGKIKALLENGNHDRLLSSIDTEYVSWNRRCDLLIRKLQELAKK